MALPLITCTLRLAAHVCERDSHHSGAHVGRQTNARLPPHSSRPLRGKFHRMGRRRNLDFHHLRTHGSLEGLRAIARSRATLGRKSRQPHLECFGCPAFSHRRRRGAFSRAHRARRFFSRELGARNLPNSSRPAHWRRYSYARQRILRHIRSVQATIHCLRHPRTSLAGIRSQVAAALHQESEAQK
jgi:hypothetical protein